MYPRICFAWEMQLHVPLPSLNLIKLSSKNDGYSSHVTYSRKLFLTAEKVFEKLFYVFIPMVTTVSMATLATM